MSSLLDGRSAWIERRRLLSTPSGVPAFLRHVFATVPHYGRLRVSESGTVPWRRIPLTARSDIAADPPAFRSTQIASIDGYRIESSGTTGAPIEIVLDPAAWFDLNQASWADLARVVPSLTRHLSPTAIAVFLVTDKPGSDSFDSLLAPLSARIRRIVLLEQDESARELVRSLRGVRIPLLYGYPATLLQLAEVDAAAGGRRRIAPEAILTSGGNLYDDYRQRLRNHFRCDVFNAYTSAEGGMVALECPLHQGLHVLSHRVRLEVRTDRQRVDREGSGEVVLTNLMNWAMPFVRYITGDWASMRITDCRCGRVGQTIWDLSGREILAFPLPGERRLDTDAIACHLQTLPIRDFRIDQLAPSSFLIHWQPVDSAQNVRSVERSITNFFAMRVPDCDVRIHAVRSFWAPGVKVFRYTAKSDSEMPSQAQAAKR